MRKKSAKRSTGQKFAIPAYVQVTASDLAASASSALRQCGREAGGNRTAAGKMPGSRTAPARLQQLR
jgi:hypothetical protein